MCDPSPTSAMFRTGLLIVTRPWPQIKGLIPAYLSEMNRLVSSTLYIHFQPDFCGRKPYNKVPQNPLKSVPFTADARSVIRDFYATGSRLCSNLDMHVLLGNVCNSTSHINKYKLQNVCDLVMVDCVLHEDFKSDIITSIQSSFTLDPTATVKCLNVGSDSDHNNADSEVDTDTLAETETKRRKLDQMMATTDRISQHNNVVLGGTFDRLHTGHKLLLAEGCLLATGSLTIGVTVGDMNNKKVLCDLIEPVDKRISVLRRFLEEVKPTLEYRLVPIIDSFGPTVTEPEFDLIVLSQETKKGGEIINIEREKKGMKRLEEYTIELLEDGCHNQYEETKISSSSLRKRLLGTVFHPLKTDVDVKERPYIIGLTGGIASGKSAICKRLEGLGCVTVDCDKLGHKAYVKGTPGFEKVVEAFGNDIIGQEGEVDRKALGKIVFADKGSLQKLNNIVWPEIAQLAKVEIDQLAKAGHHVIILEAAILLEAGWESMTHEVWVTIIPSDEAVRRIVERNHITEEQARQRVDSQLSNAERVEKSNVILSSLWEYEYTQSQVEKAWSLLKQRIGLQDTVKSNM